MGGFARRMSYWNAFARTYPAVPSLRLDGGSIFNSGVAEAPVVNRWMLEGTFKSALDACNLSAWDLPVWAEMADLAEAGLVPKEYLKLPLVSANCKPKSASFPAVERYVVKEYAVAGKRVRIGITGLLFDPEERISRRDFSIQDPAVAARQVVEELRDKTDYRVVLTDMDIGRAISLAVVVPGIHLMVVSHNYEAVSEAQQIGETLIVVPVNEGRAVGEVRVALAGAKPESEDRFVALDRTVPDDPALGELLRKAQAQLDGFLNKK
jgi:2',3'-cyclic-nucleotide 2'-phosphodiesterase (5'-nucleotidase family)